MEVAIDNSLVLIIKRRVLKGGVRQIHNFAEYLFFEHQSEQIFKFPSLERWIQANMERGSTLHAAVLLKEGGIDGYKELYSHSKGIHFLQADAKIFESYQITEYPYFVYVNTKQEIVYASPDPEGWWGRKDIPLQSCAE
ncbi:hypothetical protein PDENDC454_27583 [Paenibacillus dendritiformis C454]|uniref:Uncharacterized protein n=1 Tax=Paenibacillus dendritiformis C454 TaxID=1131935 RepID=H3SPK6_9BACL|nr:hypothetical protein PDENDC454_27583 [Paenibacillus dendritiformis C454]